ncbi:MAG: hypothetical protein BWZ10_01417 [candidate division BRC1 bacterium ADurb.BinA364]|nr:MAG: hypothetical protein BWZ10_01417 [candidate division BRC1 bacterium ADurb.BinA364]
MFRPEISAWKNPWSNQSALFRTSDGGMARINEFRRIGAGESRMSILGTLGAYEEQTAQAVWTVLGAGKGKHEDVSWVRAVDGVEIGEHNLGALPREFIGRKHIGVSRLAPVERLPKEFVGLQNQHEGSHQFLVVDFLEACLSGKLPPNHAWMAARYNAPGIAALESCKRGEPVKVPDFGLPPAGASFLDPRYPMKP